MNVLAYVALIGWIPVVLVVFASLPARRAVVTVSIAAWLFLPVASLKLPGLPDLTKTSATTLGLMLGSLLFDDMRVFRLRPRWFDLPILTWCLVPFASSVTNGLGAYDGFSSVFYQTLTWGLPYAIGRAYFGDQDGLLDLARGVVVGGLIYVPFCLWEIRMSPQLHKTLYGYQPSDFGMTLRLGGYRPLVFMDNGLEIGMWMAAASMIGLWLWACGTIKRIGNVSLGLPLLVLLATTVLCKSTGALILLATGVVLLGVAAWARWRWAIWGLVLAGPLYMGARSTALWSGERAVEFAKTWVDAARAQSLGFRLENEDILVVKALQRPVFGWGGWGRARVYDESGRDISVTDGLWIIALGNHGIVGLVSVTAALLMPLILLLKRQAVQSWKDPAIAPAAAIAVLLGLYLIDNLMNGMINPIYFLALGGMTGLGCRPGEAAGACSHEVNPGRPPSPSIEEAGSVHEGEAVYRQAIEHFASLATIYPAIPEHRRDLAFSCEALGIFQAELGLPREAAISLFQALEIWARLVADFPGAPEYRRRWINGYNDLAWVIANDLESRSFDPAAAVLLASKAVEMAPECGPYWNTLGAASYRAGDYRKAIEALNQSVGLNFGGTGFDHFFLAMSFWRSGSQANARVWYERWGDRANARAWYDRGVEWMEINEPAQAELTRLRAEAASLLAQPDSSDRTS